MTSHNLAYTALRLRQLSRKVSISYKTLLTSAHRAAVHGNVKRRVVFRKPSLINGSSSYRYNRFAFGNACDFTNDPVAQRIEDSGESVPKLFGIVSLT